MREWETPPQPNKYGHAANDPLNRRFKRDSKSNRRHRPAGAPVYKKGSKPAAPTGGGKKGKGK